MSHLGRSLCICRSGWLFCLSLCAHWWKLKVFLSLLKAEQKICLRTPSMVKTFFFPPSSLLHKKTSTILFVYFSKCLTHCLWLLSDNLIWTSSLDFQASPLSRQTSLPLSHGSSFLFLSCSLPLNAHSIDVFLPSIMAPVMPWLLLASPLCLPPFICQRFSPVFFPQVHVVSCTLMYRGFKELFKANTDFGPKICWWPECQQHKRE